MLQLAASEKLTGQCPNCGWCPPPQNAFRPNIMNEYVNEKGQVVVLSESADKVESPAGVFLRNRDDNGHLIKRDKGVPPAGAVGGQTNASSAAPTVKATPAQQTIVPSREIPASLIKTPEEVANTPKPVLAPVVLPTPVASNPAAPAQTPEAKQP